MLETECIIWAGPTDKDGYGKASEGRLAHRVVYVREVGPIPPGLELDHLCRVRNCVNPEHLEPVTHAENMRRMLRTNITRRKQCKNGHEYTEENTMFDTAGYRRCRICLRANQRRAYLARKARAS